MFKLDFINARGDVLTLSKNEYFTLINVDGLTTANTNISSLTIGGVDGDTVNNVQTQPRPIIIDLKPKMNSSVEESKREILKVVKIKQKGTLVWTQNERTVEISGIVETVDMPRFNDSVTMQIALHCEQPYWEDIETVVQEISEALALHYFTDYDNDMLYFPENGIPFGEYDFSRTRKIYNAGDVAVGIEFEILAYDTVTNPIIYDEYGNFFGVGYGTGNKKVTLQSGDIIRISTVKGKKSVTLNDTTNLLGKMKPKSTFLQLEAGDNTFSVNSDDVSTENMTFTLNFKQQYV